MISFLFDSGDRDFMRYGHNRVHAKTKVIEIVSSLGINRMLFSIYYRETYTKRDRA